MQLFRYRMIPAFASALLTAAGFFPAASAETIAMIGTGEVGSQLGPHLASLGHEVIYGSRTPSRDDVRQLVVGTGNGASARLPDAAAEPADIVVLAVPWDAVEAVVESLGNLSGKIILDPTNPRRDMPDGFRDHAFEGSNAERIQALAPDALVVKAFNTLGAETMADPERANGPVTIPLAGDDVAAKRRVAEIVESMGLEPIDVGPLRYSRLVEGLHYLRYNAARAGQSYEYHFRLTDD